MGSPCDCVYVEVCNTNFKSTQENHMQQQLQFALMNIERCAAAKRHVCVWNSSNKTLFEIFALLNFIVVVYRWKPNMHQHRTL